MSIFVDIYRRLKTGSTTHNAPNSHTPGTRNKEQGTRNKEQGTRNHLPRLTTGVTVSSSVYMLPIDNRQNFFNPFRVECYMNFPDQEFHP
ncbi:MAG: hypothetical protein AMS27_11265 [Bacteroides sp. SM23_62_1]|nr:MAG: hypothetical protein AMS27_11265 [Bacteroides sp. SM23_62_1]